MTDLGKWLVGLLGTSLLGVIWFVVRRASLWASLISDVSHLSRAFDEFSTSMRGELGEMKTSVKEVNQYLIGFIRTAGELEGKIAVLTHDVQDRPTRADVQDLIRRDRNELREEIGVMLKGLRR